MFLRKMTVHVRLVPAMAALSLFSAGCTQTAFESDIPPEEKAQIAKITELTPKMQEKRRLVQNDVILRGVHPKSHGCVAASFKINENIEDRFRVGLFASRGKVFEAVVRYSNAAVDIGDDLKKGRSGRENGSRGMAIKVRNVGGTVIIKDKNSHNQDFLMINTPEFAFRNTRDYLRLTQALHVSKNALDPSKYFDPRHNLPKNRDEIDDVIAGIQASGRVITGPHGIKSKTVRNPLQVQYFGAAPFLFGAGQAMKFSAKPCGQVVPQEPFTRSEKEMPPKAGALSLDYLRAALTKTIRGKEDVCFDFMIQVRSSDEVDRENIDDATSRWPNELDNYRSVAKIVIEAPQRPDTPAAIEQCEALAFTPWHTLEEHRPLGSINRMRRDVYDASARHRLPTYPAKR